ncbi:MAG: 2,3-bisphosphoglycerate-independent phosphoglycerate mutase, partial [Thermodesulfobacteriota bacterium]
GDLEAAIKGCEAVDEAVGRVVEAALSMGSAVLITSDHGNAEQMSDYEADQPHTAHTTNLVPLILVDDERKGVELVEGGGLSDVAPTVLEVMGLETPEEMKGKSLIKVLPHG